MLWNSVQRFSKHLIFLLYFLKTIKKSKNNFIYIAVNPYSLSNQPSTQSPFKFQTKVPNESTPQSSSLISSVSSIITLKLEDLYTQANSASRRLTLVNFKVVNFDFNFSFNFKAKAVTNNGIKGMVGKSGDLIGREYSTIIVLNRGGRKKK